MDSEFPAIDAARPARDDRPPCSCGRPSSHGRLAIAVPAEHHDRARLVLDTTCDHHPSESTGSPGNPPPQPLHADPGSAARVGEVAVLWPDLATAAFVLGLATAWLPLPLLIVDLSARAVFTNHAWSSLTGLGSDESLGTGWQSAIDDWNGRSTADGLRDTSAQPFEVTLGEPSGRRRLGTLVSMEGVTGFDGALLGNVLWVPEFGPRAELDPLVAGFLARLQRTLDGHSHASTTIAALVVELDDVAAESTEGAERDDDIDVALMGQIQPLLAECQTLGLLGHRRVGVVCEEVGSYEEVIRLAERLVGLGDPPATAGDVTAAVVSVGVAFPHLPGERAERLLEHALQAVQVARAQGGSGFEVVIGTGPGSSDVEPRRADSLQEHLSAPSADLQLGHPSSSHNTEFGGGRR